MKKFILFALIWAISFAAFGQGNPLALANGDTANNTTPVVKVMPIISAGYAGITFQPVITKISGTVAGNAVLYESVGGAPYVSTGDTIKFTNITTNTKVIHKSSGFLSTNYEWIVTGSGTMSAQCLFYWSYPFLSTKIQP